MKLMTGTRGGPPSSAALQSILDSLRSAGPAPGVPAAIPSGNPWEAFAASLSSPDISRVNIIPPTFDPSRPPTEAELARARAAGDEAQRAATQVFSQAYGTAAARTVGTPANLMLTALLGSAAGANAEPPSAFFAPASPGISKSGFFEDDDDQTPGAAPRPLEPGLGRLYPTTCPIHTAVPAALGGAVR